MENVGKNIFLTRIASYLWASAREIVYHSQRKMAAKVYALSAGYINVFSYYSTVYAYFLTSPNSAPCGLVNNKPAIISQLFENVRSVSEKESKRKWTASINLNKKVRKKFNASIRAYIRKNVFYIFCVYISVSSHRLGNIKKKHGQYRTSADESCRMGVDFGWGCHCMRSEVRFTLCT